MTYDEWYQQHWADAPTDMADRTFGEEVWNAAKQDGQQNGDDLGS